MKTLADFRAAMGSTATGYDAEQDILAVQQYIAYLVEEIKKRDERIEIFEHYAVVSVWDGDISQSFAANHLGISRERQEELLKHLIKKGEVEG